MYDCQQNPNHESDQEEGDRPEDEDRSGEGEKQQRFDLHQHASQVRYEPGERESVQPKGDGNGDG